MATTKIADNEAYSIYVLASKNRVYFKIKGYWRNAAAVPEYLNDWSKALNLLNDRFTMVTDSTEMKAHPDDVKELHHQVQAMLLKKQVIRVAGISTTSITEFQLNNIAKTTGLPKKNFRDLAEAEKWLDEMTS